MLHYDKLDRTVENVENSEEAVGKIFFGMSWRQRSSTSVLIKVALERRLLLVTAKVRYSIAIKIFFLKKNSIEKWHAYHSKGVSS